MNSSLLLCAVFLFCFSICINICLADSDNVQDVCPTAPAGQRTVFINGFPCKNPVNSIASDFKTSKLNHAGNTDNFYRSSMTIVTAADFPGLNTLGLSIARTDIAVDGLVVPDAHPRASEILFVSQGTVVAGFVDTKNQPFQKLLREGDVFIFPRGLLHFILNAGYEAATIFSVLNSQNPGVVSISGALFEPESDMVRRLIMRRTISLAALVVNGNKNTTLAGFQDYYKVQAMKTN